MHQQNDPNRSSSTAQLVQNAVLSLRTLTIAKVLKVLPHGWVEVDPQIQMVVRDPKTGVETPRSISPLARVPVGFFKAGGFLMTLPMASGDEGIVLFSDRSLDQWKTTGKKGPPREARFHDLSDGVFIPFPTSKPGAIQGYNTTDAYFGREDGSSFVKVGGDGVVTVKAATKVVVDTPLTEFTGDVQGAGKATFADIVTALNFIAGTYNARQHTHTSTPAGTPTSAPNL